MRIGIGHPGAKELVNGYVLHDFAKADQRVGRPAARGDCRKRAALAAGDDSTFMNRVHLATTGEEEKAEKPAPRAPSEPAAASPSRQAPPGKRLWRRLRWPEEALRPRALKAVPPHILGK